VHSLIARNGGLGDRDADRAPKSSTGRQTDYENGVISVKWEDNRGKWERTTFVSRVDSVGVQHLAAPSGGKFGCELHLFCDAGLNVLSHGATAQDASDTDFLNLRVKYPAHSFEAGYEIVCRVVTDGTKSLDGSILKISGASEVLLLSKSVRYDGTWKGGVPAEQDWGKRPLQEFLGKISAGYVELLQRHATNHALMFDRVQLDLHASEADRAKPTEELIREQKASALPLPAMMERVYQAGRYHFMACGGAHETPDLLGLWTGDSSAGWEGRYTLDANINMQISGGNLMDLPEMMEGFFWFNEQWMEGERQGAEWLLGCRGFLCPWHTTSSDGMIAGDSKEWPSEYCTGGMAWLIYPFWERYLVTGDVRFLRERVWPILRPMGDFYEDFLVKKDEHGKFIFAGSISPENWPRFQGSTLLAINSVYDICGARMALTWLIEMCQTLKQDLESIPKWQSLIDNLPPLLINSDHALSEWAWPALLECQNYQHRHSSGQIGAWPYRLITPERNVTLWEAVKEFHRRKAQGSYEGGMAFAICHASLIATILNEPEFVAEKLVMLIAADFYFTSLATAHYPHHRVFCTDAALAVPTILLESVLGSDAGLLELLPAPPPGLDTGVVRGMQCRSRLEVNELKWDMISGHASLVITSRVSQKLKFIHRKGFTTFDVKVPFVVDSPIQRTVRLQAGEKTTITVAFPGKTSLARAAA
jgi:hypothetical protein